MAFYLTVAVVAALLALGIYFVAAKKQVVAGRILITLVTGGVMLALALYFSVILSFITVDAWFYITMLFIFAALVTAAVCCAVCGVFKHRAAAASLTGAIILCAVVTAGFYSYHDYIDSIPALSENDDLLSSYAPYAQNTRAVTLEEPSALQFTSDFPRMDGATALYPVYASFARAVYPKEVIDDIGLEHAPQINENPYLKCTTTTGAYASIVNGEADIIFVAAPSEQQQKAAEDSGVSLVFTPIGKEAFVFFVNAQNPLDTISLTDIQKIYTGEIGDWAQLGVSGMGRIRAFQRPEGSGSQSALLRLMEGKQLAEPPKEDIIDGMGTIISRTADYKNYKNAIGYSFRFYATEMVSNHQIKLLRVNDIQPSTQNIENGSYPIASDFYAVTRRDCSENTKQLLAWILSEQGQSIIARTGYTPVQAAQH